VLLVTVYCIVQFVVMLRRHVRVASGQVESLLDDRGADVHRNRCYCGVWAGV